MSWPAVIQDALSPLCPSATRATLPLCSPSSSGDKESGDDDHDIHTIGRELAEAGRALRDGCWEVEWLKACLSVTETTLGAVDGEVAKARAIDRAVHAELAGELSFIFVTFFMELFLPQCGSL